MSNVHTGEGSDKPRYVKIVVVQAAGDADDQPRRVKVVRDGQVGNARCSSGSCWACRTTWGLGEVAKPE